MIKPINYNLKNNESDFDISIKEEERWDTESYSDTRIEFSIKVKNNKEQNREIEISNIITYIDKCDGDKLIEMEKIIEKYKNDYVNNFKRKLQKKIDCLERDLSSKQREMSRLKKKGDFLNKFMNDIREGSDNGTIAALSKKEF